MWETLIDNIKTVLDTLTGDGQKLSKVYDYPASKIEGYPCVIFYPNTVTNDFFTPSENFKVYNFKLFIVCETKIAGKQTAFNTYLA